MRVMLHDETRSTVSERLEYRVTPDPGSALGEVVIRIEAGPFSLQDYLTPDQADELAAALTAIAVRCRDEAAA